MSAGITGTYEGEGPNVSGTLAVTANVADIPTQNKQRTTTGQGITAGVTVDIRRRLRTSNEAARGGIAINFSVSDQVFSKATRYLHVSTAGTLVVRFADDSADVTLVLAVGVYPYAIAAIRNSGSASVVGVALF